MKLTQRARSRPSAHGYGLLAPSLPVSLDTTSAPSAQDILRTLSVLIPCVPDPDVFQSPSRSRPPHASRLLCLDTKRHNACNHVALARSSRRATDHKVATKPLCERRMRKLATAGRSHVHCFVRHSSFDVN